MLRASWSARNKISLAWPSFRTGAHATVLSRIVRVAWSSAVVTDLYESKAAQCEKRVRQATDGPQRAFYEVLAHYYGKLATDFRRIIAKRHAMRVSRDRERGFQGNVSMDFRRS